jgi:hypothetical protein
MKSKIAVSLVLVFGLGICAAYADSNARTVAIWECKLEEGKTKADVQAANAKWVKHVNAGAEEGEIRSFVLSTIVGDHGMFLYVDSFPSGSAWVASRAAMQSEEGKAIEKELDEVATCSSNSLYESERTLAAE